MPSRHPPPKLRLIRTEIPDIIPGPEPYPVLLQASRGSGDHRHHLQHLIGLQDQPRLVGRPPHWNRHRHLPRVHPRGDEVVEQGLDLPQRRPCDLRVAAHRDAHGLQVGDGLHGRAPAPLHSPQRVVHLLQGVDGHRRALDARLLRLARPLGGHSPAPGGHGELHAARSYLLPDAHPVVSQVGLSADDGDLLAADLLKLANQVEGLFGAELVGPGAPRARAAVAAGQVAAEGDLPDGVDGAPALVDGAGLVGERQVAPGRGRRRGDGERAGSGSEVCHGCRVGYFGLCQRGSRRGRRAASAQG